MNADSPSVTIAIPTYQRTAFLREALDGCLRQRYENFEVYLSDDSSHNEIRDLAASYRSDRIRYVKNDPPLGLMPKLNRFLQDARGDWLVVLCDDDRLDPAYLETLTPCLMQDPEIVFVKPRYRLIDQDGKTLREDAPFPKTLEPYEFVRRIFLRNRECFTINVTGVLFSRRKLLALGGFQDTYLGLHADRLAWAALGASGRTVFDPSVLCDIRVHPQSVSGGSKRDYRKAVGATRQAALFGSRILDRLEAAAGGEPQKKCVLEARAHLAAYARRCYQSGLDKGLRSALEAPDPAAAKGLREILDYARTEGLPLPSSAPLYRLFASWPAALRKPALAALSRYKQSQN